MSVFLFQFPHVLMRCLHVVIADLFQYLLQKRLLNTHTHTHTRLTALSPGLPRWASTRKAKPNLDPTEARDSELQWYQLGHMQICTSLQTDNHASTPPLNIKHIKHQHIIKYSTASHVTQILIISPNCPTCNNVTQVRLKATVPAIYIQQLLRVQHILKKLELNFKKNPWKFEINLKQTAQHLKKMTKLKFQLIWKSGTRARWTDQTIIQLMHTW